MSVYSHQLMIEMIKRLLPTYQESRLDLLTITAEDVSKGKAVDLTFHFGVDGYEWE
jgi:hypothetical protein